MSNIQTAAELAIEALKRHVSTLEADLRRSVGELAKYEKIDTKEAMGFLKEPWCILPKSREEWWVVIPKWAGVQVGWLERATDTYNVFVVNRYSHWLGQVPQELRERLKLPERLEARVRDGKLEASPEVADRFRRHLRGGSQKEGWNVVRGHEFDLLADLIEAGSLPFTPRPVAQGDLEPAVHFQGELAQMNAEQLAGWEDFLRYGAVIVCWPWGFGKTRIGLYAINCLKGRALVVVPTLTLKEQWEARARKCLPLGKVPTVVTYNAYERVRDQEWSLVIFDECHRLPANTFSRLATIRAKYRMGLSASPYREDGRTSHIFALTGFPVGVDWTGYLRSGQVKKPQVEVRILAGWREKTQVTKAEVEENRGKTLVFCDSIDQGRALAGFLRVPHVHGGTKNRLEALSSAKAAVVSRVGDEGVSIEGLSKVVEVDFLGGSRRQESQRVGRLFHANGQGRHVVLMTQDEFDRFENRFLALEEKGIRVEVKA